MPDPTISAPPIRPVPTATPLGSITAAALQARTFPPLKYAVDGMLSEGLTMLAGSPKVGKSWLSLDVALAVAAGGLALGSIPVQQRGVVVLALEDGPRRLQDRIQALYGDQPWPEHLHLATERPASLRDALDEHLDHHPDTGLVVLDTLGRIRPPIRPGDSASAYDLDYRFAGQLQKWATERRVCLLALHHDRKLGAGDFVQAVSGTYGLTGAADSILLLTRDRGSDDGLLQLTGRDIPDDLAWQLTRKGPAWQLAGKVRPELAAATAGLGDRSAEVARFVVNAPNGVTPADVMAVTGLDRAAVDNYLKRLTDAGRIVRLGRGRYGGSTSSTLQEVREVIDPPFLPLHESRTSITSITPAGDTA